MATQAELDALEAALLASAGDPAEVQTDMGRVKAHSLVDQIELDRYLRELNAGSATNTKKRGLRFTKLVPPGAD